MSLTNGSEISKPKKVRDSNIELYRIVLMLIIVAHHYVVNSGLLEMFDYKHASGNQVFLELFGWGGKTGINCFILITGYFMCLQQFTWRKFLKLYLEVKFYKIAIFIILCATGVQAFSVVGAYKVIFNVALSLGRNFVSSFIALFFLIPFINKMIHAMTQKQHGGLLIVLFVIYTIVGTFTPNKFYEYIGWYSTVYLIGAYIRLYGMPSRLDGHYGRNALLLLALSLASVLAIGYINSKRGHFDIYYFVSDSNKILAIATAIALFNYFAHLKMRPSKFINVTATATLGVLLIHGNSEAMRHLLWFDTFKNTTFFDSPWLPLHAIGTVLIIYFTCVAIDLFRQKFIEKPFFNWLDKKYPKLSKGFDFQ